MADVTITISGGTISVDKNKVTVSKKDTVKWTSHDGSFGLEFPSGSDITNKIASQNGGVWKAECGPFTNTGTFKYDVTANGFRLDPDIEIIP